jgi:phosphoribosylamine-glycine ligase
MQSSLSGLLKATVRQQLGAYRLETSGAACAVTLCTKAYPDEDQPNSGKLDIDQIPFLLAGQDSGIVNAGTEFDAGAKQAKITNGVVFSALAKGADFEKAKENAYRLAALVPSLEKRNDIGQNLNIPQKFILV